MRFYPTADVDFFVDVSNGWDQQCRYSKSKSWKTYNARNVRPDRTYMNYWGDIEGAKKKFIKPKDLYFDDWPTRNTRFGACLPLLYAMGERFIRLEKAYPAGFRCSPLPINLAEYRDITKRLRQQVKAIKALKRLEKKAALEAAKKNKKKKGKRGVKK